MNSPDGDLPTFRTKEGIIIIIIIYENNRYNIIRYDGTYRYYPIKYNMNNMNYLTTYPLYRVLYLNIYATLIDVVFAEIRFNETCDDRFPNILAENAPLFCKRPKTRTHNNNRGKRFYLPTRRVVALLLDKSE